MANEGGFGYFRQAVKPFPVDSAAAVGLYRYIADALRGDVVKKMRPLGRSRSHFLRSSLNNDACPRDVSPLYGYSEERIRAVPASGTDQQILAAGMLQAATELPASYGRWDRS